MEAVRCVEEAAAAVAGLGLQPRAAVVGVGGAGCHLVSALRGKEPTGVDLVAVNSDTPALERSEADVKVLLTGPEVTTPESARVLAEAHWDALVALLNQDVVVLLAGLGGSTGGGAAPVVAQAAKANGATVVLLAILPFGVEGRTLAAEEALEEIRQFADASVVLANDSLVEGCAELPFRQALTIANGKAVDMIHGMVQRVADLLVTTVDDELLHAALGRGVGLDLPAEGPGDGVGGDDVQPLTMGAGGLIL